MPLREGSDELRRRPCRCACAVPAAWIDAPRGGGRSLRHAVRNHLWADRAAADEYTLARALYGGDGRILAGDEAVLVRLDAQFPSQLEGPGVRGRRDREHHQIGGDALLLVAERVLHEDFERIVFGHWASLQSEQALDPVHGVYHLDTGCVWGRTLTALPLDDERYFSIPCPE